MRRVVRVRQVCVNGLARPESFNRIDQYATHRYLTGYILEQLTTPPGLVRSRTYVLVVTSPLGDSVLSLPMPLQPSSGGAHPKLLPLRPVGRLVRMAAAPSARDATVATPKSEPTTPPTVHTLRSVCSGPASSITSPARHGLVRPELAEALEMVFERLARERGFTPEKPLEICLARGFRAGSRGHGEGRAADIAAVGGKTLLIWKQEWEQAVVAAEELPDAQQRAEAIAAEQRRNLGYGLYKALQEHGGWRVNQQGWRPYRDVMQLFGPWTATEGPWKAMRIEDPNPYQRQRLADQQWVFRAHQDHIHVAR